MPEKTVQKEPGKKPAPSKKPKPQQEVVVQISLSELHPFPDHPFQVREDASMQETAESVKEYGVLVPALARPREDGGYELIAGHRRSRQQYGFPHRNRTPFEKLAGGRPSRRSILFILPHSPAKRTEIFCFPVNFLLHKDLLWQGGGLDRSAQR